MERIPVGATIGAIYNFAFQNFWRLLGITWFVIVVRALLSLYVVLPLTHRMQVATAAKDVGAIGAVMLPFLGVEVATIILAVMLCVGITRLALGHRPRFAFLYIALGRDFWWLLLSIFVFFLLCLVLAVVFGVAAGSLAGAVGSAAGSSGTIQRLTPLAIVAVVYAGLFFFAIRLGTLLAPVIVAERGVGLGFRRSWNLSRGNFWRLIAIFLAVFVPLFVLGFIQVAVMGLVSGANIGAIFSSPAGMVAWSQGMSSTMQQYVYIYLPAAIGVGTLSYGLLFGAGAFAYRALVPGLRTDIADTF
jgi:hypothetical protein